MRAGENDDLGGMVVVMGGGGKERGDKSEIVDELNERVPERPSLGARNHVEHALFASAAEAALHLLSGEDVVTVARVPRAVKQLEPCLLFRWVGEGRADGLVDSGPPDGLRKVERLPPGFLVGRKVVACACRRVRWCRRRRLRRRASCACSASSRRSCRGSSRTSSTTATRPTTRTSSSARSTGGRAAASTSST